MEVRMPRQRSHPRAAAAPTHAAVAPSADDPSLTRIGGFSDAVFGFAITLLILGIRIPHPTDTDANAGLLTLLTEQWRSYLAYAISCLVVGNNWVHHRVMFAKFARADHTLVWLNLLFLLAGIAVIPVPTAVLGEWLGSAHDQAVVAAVFYGAVSTVGGLLFNLTWWYGAYHAKLTSPALTVHERRAHTLAWGPAPFVMAALT